MKTYSPPRPAARGSALIITLFFMGMITVVIVAVLISSRLERSIAHSHFDQKLAADFAREGVERVIATLGQQTGYQYKTTDPVTGLTVYRYRNYLTRPGGLVVPDTGPTGNTSATSGDASTQNTLKLSVPLSTGTPSPTGPSSADPVYAAPSLNIPSFVQQSYPTYLIDDKLATASPTGTTTTDITKPPAMKLRWIYIHQDPNATGTQSVLYDDPVDQSVTPDSRANDINATDLPKKDLARPIIGRFAYWTDDESTKLNYNLAWKRGAAGSSTNLTSMSDPSRIGLEALRLPSQSSSYLSTDQADTIRKWITTTPGRYFNSFEDARQIGQVDSMIPPVIDYNKFELTHYNHDPDTTFFGEDRILLTTNPSLVPKNPDGSYARKFIDILREDMTPSGQDFRTYKNPPDPGIPSNIAGGETGVPSGTAYYPGVTVNNKLDMVVKNLVRYISQTNWPISTDPLASFQTKYYPGTTPSSAAVSQLAVAIIDYVRMRESTNTIIPATRLGFLPNTSSATSAGIYSTNSSATTISSNAFQGSGRVPFCTEMGVTVENTRGGGVKGTDDGASGWPSGTPLPGQVTAGPATLYRCAVQYEFYLPLHCNLTSGILNFATAPGSSGERWHITPLMNGDYNADRWVEGEDHAMHEMPPGNITHDFGIYTVAISTKNCVITNPGTASSAGTTTLMPGGYAVVTIPFYRKQSFETPIGTDGSKFALRCSLSRDFMATNGLQTTGSDPTAVNAFITPQSPNPGVQMNTAFPGGDLASFCKTMPSVETDDPRCCVAQADWVAAPGSGSSWGKQNIRWSVGKTPTNINPLIPQQDTDASGKITDHSLYMPPPKVLNSSDPENGHVTSVGELGYVTTGLSANSATGSVSWRTLRLQGSNYAKSDVLPDWAFADLFAVPNVTPNTTTTTAQSANPGATPTPGLDLHNPHGNTVGGRVNINSAAIPFTDVTHDRALVGLLLHSATTGSTGSSGSLSPNDAERIAGYIANQTPVSVIPNVVVPKPIKYGAMKLSTNPAYDTPGELCEIAGIGDQGEVGEDLVRQISSLTCTRGDVFSVYTIGQAVQQSPTGVLTVTAEQRQQSMVERYVANRDTASAADDQIRFRTVYTRNLTP